MNGLLQASVFTPYLQHQSDVLNSQNDVLNSQNYTARKKDYNRSIKELTEVDTMVNKPVNSVATKFRHTRFVSEQLERLKLMVRVKAPPLKRGVETSDQTDVVVQN